MKFWLRIFALYFAYAALVTAGIVAGEHDDPTKANRRALMEAQARWNAHPVTHYRMEIGHGYKFPEGGYLCRQTVEVRYERIVALTSSKCNLSGFTVTELFALAGRAIPRHIDWVNGAGCMLWVSQSTFHPTYGFPTLIKTVQKAASPETIGVAKYQRLREVMDNREACSLDGRFSMTTEVLSFTVMD
jgi:hypothetical protein